MIKESEVNSILLCVCGHAIKRHNFDEIGVLFQCSGVDSDKGDTCWRCHQGWKDTTVDIFPLGIYQHYKGGIYDVMGVVYPSSNKDLGCIPLVVYVSRKNHTPWARPIDEFLENVTHEATSVPRFRFLEKGAAPTLPWNTK